VLVAAQIAITLRYSSTPSTLSNSVLTESGDRPVSTSKNIFVIRSVGIDDKYAHEAAMRADLAYLRGVAGVVAAAPISSPPLTDGVTASASC